MNIRPGLVSTNSRRAVWGWACGAPGEPEAEMMLAVENSDPFLPPEKPRYAMGLGAAPQMIELVASSMDMFDCVLPARLER